MYFHFFACHQLLLRTCVSLRWHLLCARTTFPASSCPRHTKAAAIRAARCLRDDRRLSHSGPRLTALWAGDARQHSLLQTRGRKSSLVLFENHIVCRVMLLSNRSVHSNIFDDLDLVTCFFWNHFLVNCSYWHYSTHKLDNNVHTHNNKYAITAAKSFNSMQNVMYSKICIKKACTVMAGEEAKRERMRALFQNKIIIYCTVIKSANVLLFHLDNVLHPFGLGIGDSIQLKIIYCDNTRHRHPHTNTHTHFLFLL